jgi:hypothetical protein
MGRIARIEADDYLRRVILTARRDDAELILRYGRFRMTDDRSAALLRAAFGIWRCGQFDEYHVSVEAAWHPSLLSALAPIEPRLQRRELCRKSRLDVRRWLLGLAGREIDGLRLERHQSGYFFISMGAPR